MEKSTALLIYFIPLVMFISYYWIKKIKQNSRAIAIKNHSRQNGMLDPVSLHPVIDTLQCIGCGSCVTACPEQNVLGLINQKAELIAPSKCIGHGACQLACPENAISLVFGSESRGVDIPDLTADFESTAKGIYIAGELGGMGLIRNAIEQGKQAVDAIEKSLKTVPQSAAELDLVIVGAGPTGIAAALNAIDKGLRYQVIEQDNLGGTVAHFPRGKIVMTAPAILPLVGKINFLETSKEKLLALWQSIEKDYQLKIAYHERLEAIEQLDGSLVVVSNKQRYSCQRVLLAIGRRGSPRKLGVPGESLNKVTYRLIDPEQYRHQRVLVVGGGDSAIEAAIAIAEQEGAEVLLSYRGESFSRSKVKNQQLLVQAQQQSDLQVLLESHVLEIKQDSVVIDTLMGQKKYPNEQVIICAGGELPNTLLKKVGINFSTKYGTL